MRSWRVQAIRDCGAKRCLYTSGDGLVTAAPRVGVGDGLSAFVHCVGQRFQVGACRSWSTDQNVPGESTAWKRRSRARPLPVLSTGCRPTWTDQASPRNVSWCGGRLPGWLAEWRGKKCGTLGNLGCFSFQNSKHLTCGEGGAVVGDDEAVMNRAFSYHDFGRPYNEPKPSAPGIVRLGTKCRMTEFQAAILLAQMKRLEEQSNRRWENARYLTEKIREIPGIVVHKLYDGVTRAAYHLYPFRYHAEKFGGVPRAKFLAALRSEGVPCSGGYSPLNRQPFFENTLNSQNFQRMYSREQLDRCRKQTSVR